jgi:protein-arginine kinase activator protein McsA
MVFIPDPTISEFELAEDLLEYFIEEEEYEKCANIRDIINLKKTINRLYEQK